MVRLLAWVAPVGYLIAAKVGAALELVDGPPPGGGQVEAWFYEETEAGRTLMAARGPCRIRRRHFRSGYTWRLGTAEKEVSALSIES